MKKYSRRTVAWITSLKMIWHVLKIHHNIVTLDVCSKRRILPSFNTLMKVLWRNKNFFSEHKESVITLFGPKIIKFAREVPRENKLSSSFEIWHFLLLSFWSWNLIYIQKPDTILPSANKANPSILVHKNINIIGIKDDCHCEFYWSLNFRVSALDSLTHDSRFKVSFISYTLYKFEWIILGNVQFPLQLYSQTCPMQII